MKNQKGITLIALVITIIVMLILVAVSVTVIIQSGLFEKTNEATQGWKAAEKNEMSYGEGVNVNVNGKDEIGIDNIVDAYTNASH